MPRAPGPLRDRSGLLGSTQVRHTHSSLTTARLLRGGGGPPPRRPSSGGMHTGGYFFHHHLRLCRAASIPLDSAGTGDTHVPLAQSDTALRALPARSLPAGSKGSGNINHNSRRCRRGERRAVDARGVALHTSPCSVMEHGTHLLHEDGYSFQIRPLLAFALPQKYGSAVDLFRAPWARRHTQNGLLSYRLRGVVRHSVFGTTG